MNLAERAFVSLFPDKSPDRRMVVRYSRRFSSFNANVRYSRDEMVFSLSDSWREVSEDIQQGLIEVLLSKVYKVNKRTINQDLYHSFMRNLSKFQVPDRQDPFLLERFRLINERFFNGLLSPPNLVWGKTAFRKLGHYEYSSDTVVISSVFLPVSDESLPLIDFVLFHELLHKKHSYDHRKLRARHHSAAFRADEARWPDKSVDEKLRSFLRKRRRRGLLRFF